MNLAQGLMRLSGLDRAALNDATIMMQELYENETRGHVYGESDWYETWATGDQIGRLFRDMQREYGRCTGYLYHETTTGDSYPTGWIFSERCQYEDTGTYGRPPEYYTRVVWVALGVKQEDEDDDQG